MNGFIPQNQAWAGRVELMDSILKNIFNKPISALEIGVWYGLGSTNIWLNNLQPNSNLCLIDAWKPYSSEEDLNEDRSYNYKKMDDLSTDAFLSAFLNIKKFQNEQSERNIEINLIRADASNFLNYFKEDSFDFIYIDGDHKYEKVKKDISMAKKLIKKDFGIICGDDLERLPTKELIEIAKKHKNRDYLRDELQFHPGVMLAISEEFSEVNMLNGFWWIACHKSKFSTKTIKYDTKQECFIDDRKKSGIVTKLHSKINQLKEDVIKI